MHTTANPLSNEVLFNGLENINLFPAYLVQVCGFDITLDSDGFDFITSVVSSQERLNEFVEVAFDGDFNPSAMVSSVCKYLDYLDNQTLVH